MHAGLPITPYMRMHAGLPIPPYMYMHAGLPITPYMMCVYACRPARYAPAYGSTQYLPQHERSACSFDELVRQPMSLSLGLREALEPGMLCSQL